MSSSGSITRLVRFLPGTYVIRSSAVCITKQLSNADNVRVRVLGKQWNVPKGTTLEPTFFFGNVAHVGCSSFLVGN